jgi:hypothetical protein
MPPPPLTPAVFHILLALVDGPLHGYAIMQAVAQSAGPSFPAGPGTVPEGRRALETESRRIVRLAQMVRAKRLASGEA